VGETITRSFNIFKVEPGGRVRWQATQESFLTAEKHVQTIILSSPGQYLIRDQFAGHTVAVGQTDVPTQADLLSK
jgi:hypothetical protein